jgi:hypothetical protein
MGSHQVLTMELVRVSVIEVCVEGNAARFHYKMSVDQYQPIGIVPWIPRQSRVPGEAGAQFEIKIKPPQQVQEWSTLLIGIDRQGPLFSLYQVQQ